MSSNKSDIISSVQSDDVATVIEHLNNLPNIDFKHNNKAGGPPLTLAWIAAFIGARKCVAEAVRRGADVDFFANQSTVRRLGLLKRESMLGLFEGGVSPNEEETKILFLSTFENELPKFNEVKALDAIIREISDLEDDYPDVDVASICKSTAFSEAVSDAADALKNLQRMPGPAAKQLKDEITQQLIEMATTMRGEILRSYALASTNVGMFAEVVKRHFRGYRKNRAWLSAAASKARNDLQARLAPSMDLYEDDEALGRWIDLALARYPIREVIAGSEAYSVPGRNNGLDFEKQAAKALEMAGFSVEPTPATGDQGADIIATLHGLKFVIQCKDYGRQVGNGAVQEVLAARAFYQGDYAVVCAPAGYTKSAKSLAATSNVLLVTPELLPDLDKLRMLVE